MPVTPAINTDLIRTDHQNDSALSRDSLSAELFNELSRVTLAINAVSLSPTEYAAARREATPSQNGLMSADYADALEELTAYMLRKQFAIQFVPDTYNDAGANTVTVNIKVTDSEGVTIGKLSNVTEVTVSKSGDTTPGGLATINGSAGPVVVTVVDGVASVTVAANAGPGVVALALSDSGATGLDVSDTAAVTFA